MRAFKLFRLSIWAALLAGCIIIGGIYLTINQTFLSKQGLSNIVKESRLAETVRSEVLLPKILQTTRGSDYAALLDDKTVTDSFNDAVSTDALNKKLDPAVEAIHKWLNSKEPSVDFSVDMSEFSDSFATKLSDRVNQKIADLPRCTARNTLAQVESGVCKSSLVTPEALSQKIKELVTRDASLAENTTLTPQSTQLSSALSRSGNDLPSYLNMLYASALVAAGIAIVITLWLLLKHRINGIVAIGVAALLAAAGLFVISIIGTQSVGTVSTDSQVQQVVRAASTTIEAVLQQQALLAAGISVGLTVIGVVLKIIIIKRRKPQQSMHLGSSDE